MDESSFVPHCGTTADLKADTRDVEKAFCSKECWNAGFNLEKAVGTTDNTDFTDESAFVQALRSDLRKAFKTGDLKNAASPREKIPKTEFKLTGFTSAIALATVEQANKLLGFLESTRMSEDKWFKIAFNPWRFLNLTWRLIPPGFGSDLSYYAYRLLGFLESVQISG